MLSIRVAGTAVWEYSMHKIGIKTETQQIWFAGIVSAAASFLRVEVSEYEMSIYKLSGYGYLVDQF